MARVSTVKRIDELEQQRDSIKRIVSKVQELYNGANSDAIVSQIIQLQLGLVEIAKVIAQYETIQAQYELSDKTESTLMRELREQSAQQERQYE